MRQGDTPYLIRTYALRSQDQDEKRSFSTARKPYFGRSPEFIRSEIAAAMREAW